MDAYKLECPECGRELLGDYVEFHRIGWYCSNCNINIYKDIYGDIRG